MVGDCFNWLMLVLYSLKKNKWKLADFGITSHATTDQASPTVNARGTGGYRAPELLSVPAEFTTKVDIWALGCTFFEVMTGKKAFHDDSSAQTYRLSTFKCPHICLLNPSIHPFFSKLLSSDNILLSQMLAREPEERPHITLLQDLFRTRCTITDFMVWSAAF